MNGRGRLTIVCDQPATSKPKFPNDLPSFHFAIVVAAKRGRCEATPLPVEINWALEIQPRPT